MGVTHLLDTNICIYIIKRQPPQVAVKFVQIKVGEVAVSSITVSELAYGVFKGRSERNRVNAERFLEPLTVLDFGEQAAWRYGELRATLERKGTPIGALDLQIAAHDLELGATLVTNNTAEFSRVEGLKLENWI